MMISAAPASNAASACRTARSPPPVCTGTSIAEQMPSMADRFSPDPKAPSRSITCNRVAPACTNALARSAGSPSYVAVVEGSPPSIRTHFPPRKSIAGITITSRVPCHGAVALVDRNERSCRRAIVRRLRTDETIIGQLLQNVPGPPCDPAAREQTRELVAWDVEIGQHGRRVEVHVGVNRVVGFFLLQHLATGFF